MPNFTSLLRLLIWLIRVWPLPNGRSRIFELACNVVPRHLANFTTTLKNSCYRLELPTGDRQAMEIICLGDCDPYLGSFIQATCAKLDKNHLFIDVGANYGAISFRMSQFGKVISFEPQKLLAQSIRNNAARNQLDIEVREHAIGQYRGFGKIIIPEGRSGEASLEPSNSGGIRISTLESEFSLEEWQRVFLIKIDIEGGELAALCGGAALFAKHQPLLILEINYDILINKAIPPQLIGAKLREFGYRTFYAIGAKLSPTEKGVPALSNIVAATEGSEELIKTFGTSSQFVPALNQFNRVVNYRL